MDELMTREEFDVFTSREEASVAYAVALARIQQLEARIAELSWKPYPETRPESNGHYLIRRKGHMIPQVRWFENRCREWFWENDDLIWWMPLPPVPE